MRPFSKTPEQFAELPIALATSPELALQRGVLVGANGKAIKTQATKYSPELRKDLWERSERLLELDATSKVNPARSNVVQGI